MIKEGNSNQKISYCINWVEHKLDFFTKNTIYSLIIIGVIGLFLRLYFFTPNIPITQDAVNYFWSAIDLSILKQFSTGFTPANNGWPIFLSIFFSVFHFDNVQDYTILQRLITISISVLTIIPVYLLCNRFFNRSYSLFGAALFVFEPRIIQNSLRGITEPLYIILLTTTLFLFFSTNKKIIYLSFAIAALTSFVRSEGMFLFFFLSIVFFVRYKKEKRMIRKYLLAASIFFLLLVPMMIIRTQITGRDALVGRLLGEVEYVISPTSLDDKKPNAVLYWIQNFQHGIIFIVWSMIPLFIFFVPYGILILASNRNQKNTEFILAIIIMFIPSFYAISRLPDTRYFLPLHPLFAVLSLFTIKNLGDSLSNPNLFLVSLMTGILLLSWFFLYSNNIDVEHEKEALKFAYYVIYNTKVINNYYPESGYLAFPSLSELPRFPILSSQWHYVGPTALDHIELSADSLEEYIEIGRKDGLTHLVLDANKNRPSIFTDAFYNEEKYPYLIKEFDSRENGYRHYFVKVFKIDYDKFDTILINKK